MGNMHVLPTEADLHNFDQKCDPISGFVPISESSDKWEHNAKFCNRCNEPFDFVFVRKHHCRVCGLAHCSRCSPKRHMLSQQRACGKCLSKIILDLKSSMLDEHTKVVGSPRTDKKQQQKQGGAFASEPDNGNHHGEPSQQQQQLSSPDAGAAESSGAHGKQENQGPPSNVSSDAEGPSPREPSS